MAVAKPEDNVLLHNPTYKAAIGRLMKAAVSSISTPVGPAEQI